MARVLRCLSMAATNARRSEKFSPEPFGGPVVGIPGTRFLTETPRRSPMKDGSTLEVTALFEDTLLSTTTLGRTRRAAWPLVLAGALGILAAGICIVRGVVVA